MATTFTMQPDITSLLTLNKQIYSEAAPILYKSNRFHFIDNFDFMAQLLGENLLREYAYHHINDAVDLTQLAKALELCPTLSGLTIYESMLDEILENPVWMPVVHRLLNYHGKYFRLAVVDDLLVCANMLVGIRLMGQDEAFEFTEVQNYIRTVVATVFSRLGVGAPATQVTDEPLVVTLKGQEMWVKMDWLAVPKSEYDEVIILLVV
jgi:hypothetical protein